MNNANCENPELKRFRLLKPTQNRQNQPKRDVHWRIKTVHWNQKTTHYPPWSAVVLAQTHFTTTQDKDKQSKTTPWTSAGVVISGWNLKQELVLPIQLRLWTIFACTFLTPQVLEAKTFHRTQPVFLNWFALLPLPPDFCISSRVLQSTMLLKVSMEEVLCQLSRILPQTPSKSDRIHFQWLIHYFLLDAPLNLPPSICERWRVFNPYTRDPSHRFVLNQRSLHSRPQLCYSNDSLIYTFPEVSSASF